MSGTADDRAERAGTTEETASEGSKAPEATPALPGRSGGGHAHQLDRAVLGSIRSIARDASENLRWLHENVPDVFLSTMREDPDAITELVTDLRRLRHDRQLILADREDELTVALLDVPGSIFHTLQRIQDREILRAEMFHSYGFVPGIDRLLEIQHYALAKAGAPAAPESPPELPTRLRREVHAAYRDRYAADTLKEADRILDLLWANQERYVRLAPPADVARLLWLYQEGEGHAGIFLHVEPPVPGTDGLERNVLFAVSNPSQKGFLVQVIEVFNELNVGVRRALVLAVNTGAQPYFLGSFHVAHRAGEHLGDGTDLFRRLRRQLYNVQILA